jgi:pimeloyl-ACP methyl ester carboxylesterase
MNRRTFLLSALAATLIGYTPSATEAAPSFTPTRFSVQVRGTGPDVILIPGLTAGRDVWTGILPALPGYRYHLVQVSGFAGEAARGNAQGEVVAPIAAELGRYISANGLQRPAVVGHSMGGTVAMMVAAREPEKVGRVMVVDMLPQPAGLFGSSAAGLGPLASSLRNIVSSPSGRRLFESFLGSRSAANRSDPDVVSRAMHELATTDLSNELPKIKAPLEVVYAARDAEDAKRADRNYRSAYAGSTAKLVRIDNSGHMIMYDQPARFARALKDFLGR